MNNALKELFAELIAEGYSTDEALEMISSGATAANTIPASSTSSTGTGAGVGGNLAAWFSGIRNKFGSGQPLFSGNIDLSSIKELGKDIRGTKLIEGGPTIGGLANLGMGVYQGGKAAKGLYENIQADSDLNSLKDDINLQVASNPMYGMYLDASDEKLLRQMRNNTLTNNWAEAGNSAVQGIPKAALSAVMGGIAGGPLGALIGGGGSLINSTIEGYGKGTEQAQANLQGLYDKLRQANEEYRTMKRPSGLRSAGLSRQYYNQLY